MRRNRNRFGVALIIAGLLASPWLVAYVATDDGSIDPVGLSAVFLFVAAAATLGGLQLLVRWVEWLPPQRPVGLVRGTTVVALCALLIAGTYWRIGSYRAGHLHVTLVDTGHERTTAEQQQWAADFHRRSLEAAVKNGWFDIDKAFEQGFQRDLINRTHFPNQEYLFDDVILDPERPEWLIYSDSPDGKVLMGFMFFTRELYEVGPTPAGTLAQWHFHPYETPRCAIEGLWTVGDPDEDGRCAEGVPVDRTPEMFHVWFIDHPLGRFTHMTVVPEYWQYDGFGAADLHPLTVHFAIGLFVVAVFLDMAAAATGRRQYHHVAWVNLVGGAIAVVAAVAVGMSAEMMAQPTHDAHQTLDTHKTLAFASLAGVLLLAGWRYTLQGRFPQRGAALYIVLSLTTLAAIGGAGYYGGEMVYRHGAGVRAVDQFARDRYWAAVRESYRQPPAAVLPAASDDQPRPAHSGH
jgi:uncharacterized membrane protein